MIKNKIFNKVLLTGSFIVILFIIAKLTGVLQYAFIPTGGNEPTIKKNSFIFMSNILPYKKYTMLAYNQNNLDYEKGVYVQRLIGVENDKIHIKEGLLYVNDSLIDRFNVKQAYKIDRAFVNDLMMTKGVNTNDFFQIDENYFITQLSKTDLKEDFFYERFINKNNDSNIFKIYSKNWNADNFGPVIIPKNKLFFLGDNRNASLDSRYLGFVDKEDIVGRIFYPKN
ncbi:signal peptidase I [Chryseobacterium sp. G0201]|uniref:signal peptidase I n=1 Tax=Chryseobacterium sp. G0201 TaxID=2487065 RepID=UPI000F509BAC|nr:signal peptidase I [Chryseobacterium sp. G0201]AZA53735.1 signal peptidase I [Chryseobacterium sp. G0201]